MSGYLLDTDAVLILGFDAARAPRRVLDQLADEPRCVSQVSALEMAVKQAIGKLKLPPSFELSFNHGFSETLSELAADLLKLELAHIDTLSRLPLKHRDPFDRLLIAQAITENLTLVSGDRVFAAYPGLNLLEL